jgi:hypothetical protein
MRIQLTNHQGDTLTIDYSKTNVRIIDSYNVTKRDMDDWIEQIKSCGETHGYRYARSNNSWRKEWKAHNMLYRWRIAPCRTKDVDFNEDESLLRRFGYFILSIFN